MRGVELSIAQGNTSTAPGRQVMIKRVSPRFFPPSTKNDGCAKATGREDFGPLEKPRSILFRTSCFYRSLPEDMTSVFTLCGWPVCLIKQKGGDVGRRPACRHYKMALASAPALSRITSVRMLWKFPRLQPRCPPLTSPLVTHI